MFVTIATYHSYAQALLARSRLESSGIACQFPDEQVVGLGYVIASGGVRLQVAEADADAARQIIGEPDKAENPSS